MKHIFIFIITLATLILNGQSVGIGTITPDTSAILDLTSTNKGFLIPRLDSLARTQIVTPAQGLMVYQTNGSKGFYYYNGSIWLKIGGDGNEWTKNGAKLFTNSEQVGIGTNDIHTSAAFQVENDVKGILIPRLSQIDREGIVGPAEGLLVYQFNHERGFYYYDGVQWNIIGKGGNEWVKNGVDLYNILNNVGIGVNFPNTKFHINNGTEATLASFTGQQLIGLTSTKNLVFDTDEIQAREGGSAAPLKLQEHGGKIGVGNIVPSSLLHLKGLDATNNRHIRLESNSSTDNTSIYAGTNFVVENSSNFGDFIFKNGYTGVNVFNVSPTGNLKTEGSTEIVGGGLLVPLKVTGGSDATVSGDSSGYLIIGNGTGENLVLDNNEIMARNNNAVDVLTLQNNGGKTLIGDDIEIKGKTLIGDDIEIKGSIVGNVNYEKTGADLTTNYQEINVSNCTFKYIVNSGILGNPNAPLNFNLTNGTQGQLLIITAEGTGDYIILNESGNVDLPSAWITIGSGDFLQLIFYGSKWHMISFTNN
jgi:hypothetical protein